MPPSPGPRMPPPAVVKLVSSFVNTLDSTRNKLLPPQVVLMGMTGIAMTGSLLIHVVAELGVPDLLKEGPRSAGELARATGMDPDALHRVLRTLSSMGLFSEEPDGTFALTRLSECLRSDVPGSMRGWARTLGAPWHWTLWGSILESVRNGKSACENLYDKRFFQWLDENPEVATSFNEWMTESSKMAIPAIVAAYDFSPFSSLVDIAGGHGSMLAAILRKTPRLKGVLLDQPKVIEGARSGELFSHPELAARCECVAGSFLESIPAGHDAYLLKWILHDWSDEEALALLQACRRAMKPGARLLIAEMLVEPGNEPSFSKQLDIVMLLLTGGRERTREEYRSLLERSDLKLRRVLPTASPYSILEAVAA